MFNSIFSNLGPKFHYWISITRHCFSQKRPLLHLSKSSSYIAIELIGLTGKSNRDDLTDAFVNNQHPIIMAIYAMIIDIHDAIQKMSISGHGRDSMALIRSQMDALMILLYFTDPYDNIPLIASRIDEYNSWVIIKMKQNMEKTENYSIIKLFDDENSFKLFKETVLESYDTVRDSLVGFRKLFEGLKKSSGFPLNKRDLAKKYKIDDLYGHVLAESSATIHLADISDRYETIELPESAQILHIPRPDESFWPVFISNLILGKGMSVFAEFYDIREYLEKLLEKEKIDIQCGDN